MSVDETPHEIRVVAKQVGGEIHLDGRDISHHVRGFTITAGAREVTRVVLDVLPRDEDRVLFEGLAHVAVAGPADPGPAAAEWLAGIDAALLQQHAINRPDLGTDPDALPRAMLVQLIEWASGGTPEWV